MTSYLDRIDQSNNLAASPLERECFANNALSKYPIDYYHVCPQQQPRFKFHYLTPDKLTCDQRFATCSLKPVNFNLGYAKIFQKMNLLFYHEQLNVMLCYVITKYQGHLYAN